MRAGWVQELQHLDPTRFDHGRFEGMAEDRTSKQDVALGRRLYDGQLLARFEENRPQAAGRFLFKPANGLPGPADYNVVPAADAAQQGRGGDARGGTSSFASHAPRFPRLKHVRWAAWGCFCGAAAMAAGWFLTACAEGAGPRHVRCQHWRHARVAARNGTPQGHLYPGVDALWAIE